MVRQKVDGPLSCIFHCGDYIRQSVRISSSCDRQGPNVVNTDGYSGANGQGDVEYACIYVWSSHIEE